MNRSVIRRFAAVLEVALLGFAGYTWIAQPAYAAATISVAPSTNLTNGQTAAVTVSGMSASAPAAGVFLAVTQCGNATSAGTPLTLAAQGDCAGAEGLADGSLNLGGFAWPGATANVSLTMKQTGIGSNNAKCIMGGTIPCTVVASTATVAGAYTGAGSVSLTKTISYVAAVTTTTAGATTTTAGATTTTAGATTTTAGATTTTAGATTTTAGATGPALVAVPGTGLSDGQTITARLTGMTAAAPAAGVFVAVTQCGNASKDGVLLATATDKDCVGGEGLTDGTLNLNGFTWPGSSKDVPLVLKRIGIGTNGAQCVAAGTIPCTIVAATAAVTGSYTGSGSFSLTAPISYAGGAGTTTTTPVVTPTTPTTPTGKSQVPVVAVLGARVTSPANALPRTGGSPWPLIFLGLAALDAGWLLVTGSTPSRRWMRRQRQAA
jgi:hypothetical protein